MKLIRVKLNNKSKHWGNKDLIESMTFFLVAKQLRWDKTFLIEVYDPLCIYRKNKFEILVDDYEVIDANPGQNDQQGPDQAHHE